MGKSGILRGLLIGILPVGGVAIAALSAQAQDGGVRLTFGVSQTLEATENAELRTDSRGTTYQSDTRLSFSAVSETRTDRLAFDASTALRVIDEPDGDGTDATVDSPRLNFSYRRETPAARFEAQARYSESDIRFTRLGDLLDPDVTLTPEDIENLRGEGTRRNTFARVSLDWGLDDPLGFGLTASASRLRYSDTDDNDLFDSDREEIGARARLRLSPVLSATAELEYSRFDDTDPTNEPRDTLGLDLGLTLDRPLGAITTSLSATDTEDGTRLGFSIGRDYALPEGALSARIGLTRPAEGGTELTGSVDWRQDLPRASISARIERDVISGTDDTDRTVTEASIAYDRPLTEVSSLGLDLSFVESRNTDTGDAVSDADLSATYTRSLTEDWGLDLGVSHRVRDAEGAGSADSTSVFVTLDRSFDFRR